MILTLDVVPINTKTKIVDLRSDGQMRRRLMDFGLSSGSEIVPVLGSAVGDTRAYLIKDTLIAIRQEDAEGIRVRIF